jgi:hypothetical protein
VALVASEMGRRIGCHGNWLQIDLAYKMWL